MRHVVANNQRTDDKPLTEPVFLILTSLAKEPRHGYALMQDIQVISKDRVILSTGTLYGALRRLLEDGWIERFEQQDTSRDKQAYRLTAEGRHLLQSEIERMTHLVRAATLRLKMREV